jgi:hypothetical protein
MSTIADLKIVENIDEILYNIKPSKKKQSSDVKFENIHVNPPLAYMSKSENSNSESYKLDPFLKFKKSGLLLYTKYKEETIFFMAVFTGTDRDKKIEAELCDFGGKVESDENFIQAAVNETLEESLGIFNFKNKENEIASISEAIFTMDRALIYLLTPITINLKPKEYIELFDSRKKQISEEKNKYKYISEIEDFEYPELDLQNTNKNKFNYNTKSKNTRKDFNYNEIRNIVYISHENLIKLINNETVALPKSLAKSLNMTNYPKLYFAVADRLRNNSFFMNL